VLINQLLKTNKAIVSEDLDSLESIIKLKPIKDDNSEHGVYYDKARRCFKAQVSIRHDKNLYIGVFDSIEEAKAARKRFIFHIHKGLTVKESLSIIRTKRKTPRKTRTHKWSDPCKKAM
jgi:AP2 domain